MGTLGRRSLSWRRRLLFAALLVAPVVALGESATGWFYHNRAPWLETMRLRLAGDDLPVFLKCVGQAYLLYIPNPGFTEDGRLEHNAQGYRGSAVPRQRTPGVARVLCLGGSTTYGAVRRWDETYPARLAALLEASKPAGVAAVEVINAGLPYGTTAEILTHYHFKFHYYRPDLVVVDTGGNDAMAMVAPHYHPDYSHWRQEMCVVRPLPPQTRWLMSSRLASLAGIWLMYGTDVERYTAFIREGGRPPRAVWYQPEAAPAPGETPLVAPSDLAFTHNLEVLLDEIRGDGAKVLLVPFRPSPANRYPAPLLAEMTRNEGILRDTAASRGLGYAPYPASVVTSPPSWVDDCHLDAKGESEKAAYLAPDVAALLWGD